MLAPAAPLFVLNFIAPFMLYDIPTRPQSWHAVALLPLVALVALATVEGVRQALVLADKLRWRGLVEPVLAVVLVASGVMASVASSSMPFARSNYLDPAWLYSADDRSAATRELSTFVPEEASVSAEVAVGLHLVNRRHIYVFPMHWTTVDYVVLNHRSRMPLDRETPAILRELHASAAHEIVYDRNDFLVFRRIVR